jgi:hypothetical protein
MAARSEDQNAGALRPSAFRRLSVLQGLPEVVTDRDSDEDDFNAGDDESDEEETDSNQHHRLLSGLLQECGVDNDDDDDDDPDFEPEEASAETEFTETESEEPAASTSFAPAPARGSRGRGSVRSYRQRGTARGRGRARVRQSERIQSWERADRQAPNADIQFTGDPGIKKNVDNFKPVDFVELFFDDDLINSLVINTNLYADQYMQAHIQLSPHARSTDWTPVDAKDMKKFLGMILLMGIVKLPALDLYWSRRVLYRLPCFAAVMTRNRFQVSLLHLILK